MTTLRVRSPEFPRDLPWLNSKNPLTLKELRGRVILLDFWTYGCINCIHSLNDLKYLEQKYQDCLTVIGIHTAKFDNEQEVENIRQAILRYDIRHPVAVDRESKVWDHFAVRALPTWVLIDPEGYCIARLAGEGHRQKIDDAIAQLQADRAISDSPLQLALEQASQPPTPLYFPGNLHADSNRLFIADSHHHRIIISSEYGKIDQIIGTGKAGWQDGYFEQAQFRQPQGLVCHRDRLYVADTGNHLIRCLDLTQEIVTTIAGTGNQSRIFAPHGGLAREVDLNSPWDLVYLQQALYIAMAGHHQIWKLDLNHNTIQTYAGRGAEACLDGELLEAGFTQPSGITTDGQALYIADSEASSIRRIDLEPQAQVTTLCGSRDLFDFGDVDGIGEEVRLQHCLGITFAEGWLWVADTYNHKIKRITPHTGRCCTVTCAELNEPSGLSLAHNCLYIADTNNHRLCRLNLQSLSLETVEFPGLCAPEACFLPVD